MSKISFTLVQSALHWEDKRANLLAFENKLGEAVTGHVILLPEMFTTGFTMNPAPFAEDMAGPTLDWMKKMAKEKRAIICGSMIAAEEGLFYNRMVWMLPGGNFAYYDKRHLFAFAGEHERYNRGSKRLIASVNGWKINLMVCYDLRFPVWSRQQVDEAGQPEYDVLIYIANWPEKRSLAWKTLLQARAIENQCYVIGLNRVGSDGNDVYYSGNSMVIDPLGEIIYQRADEEDIVTIELDRQDLENKRNRFPFIKDADRFVLVAD